MDIILESRALIKELSQCPEPNVDNGNKANWGHRPASFQQPCNALKSGTHQQAAVPLIVHTENVPGDIPGIQSGLMPDSKPKRVPPPSYMVCGMSAGYTAGATVSDGAKFPLPAVPVGGHVCGWRWYAVCGCCRWRILLAALHPHRFANYFLHQPCVA